MKRVILLVVAVALVAMGSLSMAAMSTGKVRKNARFLTDRMAYELNLSSEQLADVYEINYDFINNVRYLMDDVVTGNAWALEDYYNMLDIRNDDLRWVLSSSQYIRFLGIEYFSRPIFASGNGWNFRVYVAYPNISFYYYSKPYHYRTYNGGHYRTYYDNRSYYSNRYHHDIYHGNHGFRDYNRYSRDDFKVTARPGTAVRPSTGNSSSRPSRPSNDDIYNNRPSNSNSSRPSGSGSSSRPSGSASSNSSARPSGNSSSRPSGSSSSRPAGTTTVRPSSTPSTGSGKSARPSGSSSSRPSGNSSTRPSNSSQSRPSSSARPSNTVKENKSSSSVSERPSSGSSSSSGNRSNSSSESNRGGRR